MTPLNWIHAWMRRRALPLESAPSVTAPQPQARRMSGKYQLLYSHLENRYADTVVLTFEQIESLLGFSLPESARTQGEWWTGADINSGHGNPWTLAHRTARPNLHACTVVFERVMS